MKLICVLAIGFTRACQIYGAFIGLTILWAGVLIILDNQASVIYVAGYPNELPLAHFNPGLGYFCFGWGLTYSGFKSLYQKANHKFSMFCGMLFGIANLLVGITDLLGYKIGFGLSTPGFLGFCLALLLGILVLETTGISISSFSGKLLKNKYKDNQNETTINLGNLDELFLNSAYRVLENLEEPQAVAEYREAAEHGDSVAQYNLGVAYIKGEGIAQDKIQAEIWFRKAAEQGFMYAQYNLARMCLFGDGITKDEAQSVKWYRKAIEQGFAPAQYELGTMYLQGQGVSKDEAKAAEFFLLAAEQGLAEAQFSLGVMCLKGEGIAKDEIQAVIWLRKAAKQNLATAQDILSKLGPQNTRNTVSVSREDEATQPDPVNWNQLGLACQTEDELNKAIEFHEKALFTYISLGRKEGEAAAYGNLGLVYQSLGNLDKSIEFHEKALRLDEAIGNNAGMAEDYRNLGLVYEVQGKLNIAIQFHQRALKLNEILDRKNGMAQNYGNLALIYQKQGNNIEAKRNYKKSIAIYKQVNSPTAETMQTLLNALR